MVQQEQVQILPSASNTDHHLPTLPSRSTCHRGIRRGSSSGAPLSSRFGSSKWSILGCCRDWSRKSGLPLQLLLLDSILSTAMATTARDTRILLSPIRIRGPSVLHQPAQHHLTTHCRISTGAQFLHLATKIVLALGESPDLHLDGTRIQDPRKLVVQGIPASSSIRPWGWGVVDRHLLHKARQTGLGRLARLLGIGHSTDRAHRGRRRCRRAEWFVKGRVAVANSRSRDRPIGRVQSVEIVGRRSEFGCSKRWSSMTGEELFIAHLVRWPILHARSSQSC